MLLLLTTNMATVPGKGGGGGWEDSAYERSGDARRLFWYHVGCSGQNAIMFSREKKYIIIYCLCFKWSLSGVKKSLGHTQIGLL